MRRKMEQMQAEMNEFVAHVRQELERGHQEGSAGEARAGAGQGAAGDDREGARQALKGDDQAPPAGAGSRTQRKPRWLLPVRTSPLPRVPIM